MLPKKTLSKEYKILVNQISKIIYEYDPIELSVFDAPKDEYDPEAALIAARLRLANSDVDVRNIINDVIKEQFGEKPDAKLTALEIASEKIWKIWQAYLEQTKIIPDNHS